MDEKKRTCVREGRGLGLKNKRMGSCHLLAWIVCHVAPQLHSQMKAPSCRPDAHQDTLSINPPAFSHVQTDTHALPLNTYTHMHRSPPAALMTPIVLGSASPSIWLPYGGAVSSCENYCTSASICTTLYKPRVGPAKVSGPTNNTW